MELRNLLAFGIGAGIEIRRHDLHVVVTRVRPGSITVAAAGTIRDFDTRPAAEWGAEYQQLLKQCGASHVSATVVLPRRDVIVRQVALPGVGDQDLPAALSFQIDSVHPYGDEEVAWAWQKTHQAGTILAGVIRQKVLQDWMDRFAEAGIALSSLTFSAAVMHGAARLRVTPPEAFFTHFEGEEDVIEIYGESPSRAVFSAEFDFDRNRVMALAASELRVQSDPVVIDQVLPGPTEASDFDFSRSALAYAASLAGATPRLAPAANLLPESARVNRSRLLMIPTAVLALMLAVAGVGLASFRSYSEREYVRTVQAEIAKLQPKADLAARFDRTIASTRQRTETLAAFRKRSTADLEALQELTRLIAPPAWTNYVQIDRNAVTVAGEAEQSAPLLEVIDKSPLFRNSSFTVAIARTASGELFRIRAEREAK
jgi:hypothetical protein